MVPEELIQALSSVKNPVIAGHVGPDTDALGSMLALTRVLPCDDVAIVLPDELLAQKLRFLMDLAGDVVLADADRIAAADCVIVVDTGATRRLNVPGGWDVVADKFVINIDHHITNPDFGSINWVVDNASSTSELICQLIQAAGWSLDAATASLLYAGIYADTGGFSLPNASASGFDAAAELVRAGADIDLVGQRLCRSQEPHEFELIRAVYHNTRLAAGGRIAYSSLSFDEITGAGCSPQDIDDQVSIPRSLSGVQIAMLFSEGEPGVIRINLRSERDIAVLPIAEKLGGGGHTCSAGVRMRGALAEVIDRVVAEATAYLSDEPDASG